MAEIIEVAGRRFRVPIIEGGDSKNTKKPVTLQMNESKWFEKIEKKAECKIGKIDKKNNYIK